MITDIGVTPKRLALANYGISRHCRMLTHLLTQQKRGESYDEAGSILNGMISGNNPIDGYVCI